MQTFMDNDRGYLAWLAKHPDGYVVNADRPPNASYLRLHRATSGPSAASRPPEALGR